MIRTKLVELGFGRDGGFRWRGREVSRLEGFSDGVFAFALTLLVVALEVPRSYAELMDTLRGFPAFALCFAVLYAIWHSHYVFFRRYAMLDGGTVAWNALLLFLVLFFIYPLKFLFGTLVDALYVSLELVPEPALGRLREGLEQSMQSADGVLLLSVYSAGYLAVSLVLALLYYRAMRRADQLDLDALERWLTTDAIQGHLIEAGVALASIVIACCGGGAWAAAGGFIYFLIGPLRAWHGWSRGRRRPVRAPVPAPELA